MTRVEMHSTRYPSLISAELFWEKAQEEYNVADTLSKKDGCEKAFRAATEAIDALLASHGMFVPVGQAHAHLDRSEFIIKLRDLDPNTRRLGEMYSTFKDQLHGNCFYTGMDPEQFQTIFNDVGEFLQKIRALLVE